MDTPSPQDTEDKNSLSAWHRERKEGRVMRVHEKRDEYADVRAGGVVTLGRKAYCSFACQLIHRELGIGEPYGVIGTNGGIAHFFLRVGESGLDMGGYSNFSQLLAMFPEVEKVAPVTWKDVSNAVTGLGFSGDSEEGEIIAQRFTDHVKKHREEWLRASREAKSRGSVSN